MYVYIYIYIYQTIYTCVYIYIYIYIHTCHLSSIGQQLCHCKGYYLMSQFPASTQDLAAA